ncbi:hypothetical protein [Erwinia phage Gungnir39]|nr:hypothetical protein [Erwinia phage Gungnir39]
MTINRLRVAVSNGDEYISESENGSLVWYKDHAAEVSRLNEQLDELKSRLQLVSELSDAAAALHIEAEKQVQAVAAENSKIKSAIESHAVGFVVCPVCSHEEPSETDDVVVMVSDIDTPATDIAILEIGAKAIEGFFAYDWQGAPSHSAISEMARDYANKLRAGEVQL